MKNEDFNNLILLFLCLIMSCHLFSCASKTNALPPIKDNIVIQFLIHKDSDYISKERYDWAFNYFINRTMLFCRQRGARQVIKLTVKYKNVNIWSVSYICWYPDEELPLESN